MKHSYEDMLHSLSSLTGDVTRAGIFAETAEELSRILKFPLIVPSTHIELVCQSGCSTMYFLQPVPVEILLFTFGKNAFLSVSCPHKIK